MTRVSLHPNEPVTVKLADPYADSCERYDAERGVGEYETTDGRILALPRAAVLKLNELNPAPGQEIVVARYDRPNGSRGSEWDVWLAVPGRIEPAPAEPQGAAPSRKPARAGARPEKGQRMLVPIRPVTVPQYVRGQMRDFKVRQEARAMKRRTKRAASPSVVQEEIFPELASEAPPPRRRRETVQGGSMRVTFRAQFQGRRGRLDTGGFRFPRPPVETVEVFRYVDNWYARIGKIELTRLGKEPSYGAMKDAVAASFTKRLTDWVMFDPDGKPLDPARVSEDAKGDFILFDTHLAAEVQDVKAKNEYKTECGTVANVTRIKNKRGDVPPTCFPCRALWDKLKASAPTVGASGQVRSK